jgi:hypothetical protein
VATLLLSALGEALGATPSQVAAILAEWYGWPAPPAQQEGAGR